MFTFFLFTLKLTSACEQLDSYLVFHISEIGSKMACELIDKNYSQINIPISMLFSQSNCFVCGQVFLDTDRRTGPLYIF